MSRNKIRNRSNNRGALRPTTKVNGRSMGDQVSVDTRTFYDVIGTDVNGNNDSSFLVIPSGSPGSPLSSIALVYQRYKALGLKFKFVPTLGMTASGIIHIAYLDNPEVIHNWDTYGTGKYTIIRNTKHCVSGHISQPLTLDVSSVGLRRKWFDTNETGSLGSIDSAERSVQGMFVVWISGTEPSAAVGQSFVEGKYILEGMTSSLAVT